MNGDGTNKSDNSKKRGRRGPGHCDGGGEGGGTA
jgi:hypothetical protein